MSEIKRAPVYIAIQRPDEEVIFYDAFDDNHTWNDIARHFMKNRVDAEELHRILGEMLNEPV